MKQISSIEAKKMVEQKELFLLDIREPYEVEICSVGGTLIPMAEINERVNELPKEQLIGVMCKSGRRAEAVANLLSTDFGLENVAIIEGGIIAWIELNQENLEIY